MAFRPAEFQHGELSNVSLTVNTAYHAHKPRQLQRDVIPLANVHSSVEDPNLATTTDTRSFQASE